MNIEPLNQRENVLNGYGNLPSYENGNLVHPDGLPSGYRPLPEDYVWEVQPEYDPYVKVPNFHLTLPTACLDGSLDAYIDQTWPVTPFTECYYDVDENDKTIFDPTRFLTLSQFVRGVLRH